MAQPKPERTSLDQVLKLASQLTLAEQQALGRALSSSSDLQAVREQQQDALSLFNRERAINYLHSRLANQSEEDQSWGDIMRALNADRLSDRKLFDA